MTRTAKFTRALQAQSAGIIDKEEAKHVVLGLFPEWHPDVCLIEGPFSGEWNLLLQARAFGLIDEDVVRARVSAIHPEWRVRLSATQ